MAKTLFILRHAKSSWDESDKRDKDRALKPKGINDIMNTARTFSERFETLDLILTSSANRAVHTAILFAETIGFPHDRIRIDPLIYQADDIELEALIKTQPDSLRGIMVVAHNPTLTYLINRFLPQSVYELPTSGMVSFDFDVGSWKDISAKAVISHFISFSR